MHLHELLDSKVPWRWTHKGHVLRGAEFEIGGKKFIVDLVRVVGLNTDRWKVSFAQIIKMMTGKDEPFYLNMHNMKREAIQVFATVIKVIEDFIHEVKPDEISFVGYKHDKRDKLYSLFLEKFKPKLQQAGYKVSSNAPENWDDEVTFSIVKDKDPAK